MVSEIFALSDFLWWIYLIPLQSWEVKHLFISTRKYTRALPTPNSKENIGSIYGSSPRDETNYINPTDKRGGR